MHQDGLKLTNYFVPVNETPPPQKKNNKADIQPS